MSRWILEGEWTGYTSGQRRIVHREIFSNMPVFRFWCERTHAIRYTDGTALLLSVRDAKPRERIGEIHGYTRLIQECFTHGVTAVTDLPKRKRPLA